MHNWMDDFVNNTDLSQNRPIREVVYESLRVILISGKVPVGERFIEKEYSQRLNISRTPVREALKQLESEDLIEYLPKIGVIVKRVTKNDVIEIYQIRQALEILVVESTIDNISQGEIDEISNILNLTEKANIDGDLESVIHLFGKFNSMIYKASKMKRLPVMISNLNNYLKRFRNISILDEERRKKALIEHRLILKSIIEKDKVLAAQVIKTHLNDSIEVVVREISE